MGPHFNLNGAIVSLMRTYLKLCIYVLLTGMLQYLELYVECSTPFVFLECLKYLYGTVVAISLYLFCLCFYKEYLWP